MKDLRAILGRVRGRPAAFLFVILGAAGCAGTPSAVIDGADDSAAPATPASSIPASDAGLTPAEQRLRRQSRAFERTVWEGSAVGVSAGALLGAYAAHGIKGVIATASAGGAAGGVAGAYLANKQKAFALAEDQLDSMIADVRRSNREMEALIASINVVIADDRRRIAAVEERHRSGQATEAELVAIRKRALENLAVVRDAARGARGQHAMFSGAERSWRKQNPSIETQALKQELEAYQRQIDTLDELAEQMSVA